MRIRFDVILIVVIMPLIGVGLFMLSNHKQLLDEVAELDARGWELYRAGDYSPAEELFALTVEKMPNRNSGYLGVGWCKWATDDYDGAEKWFMDAAALNNSQGHHYHGMAEVNRGRGHLEKAVEYYQLAIKSDKNNPAYHLGLGWLYKDMGEGEQAAQSFQQVVQLTEKRRRGPEEVDRQRVRDQAFAGLHEVSKGNEGEEEEDG